MKDLEARLLPVEKLHWDLHKIVLIKSDAQAGKFHAIEFAGKGRDQKSNTIGLLNWVEIGNLLSIIGNEQSLVNRFSGVLYIANINYVE